MSYEDELTGSGSAFKVIVGDSFNVEEIVSYQ